MSDPEREHIHENLGLFIGVRNAILLYIALWFLWLAGKELLGLYREMSSWYFRY